MSWKGDMLLYIKTGNFVVVGFGWKKKCFESSHWILDNIILAKVLAFVGLLQLFCLTSMVTNLFIDSPL